MQSKRWRSKALIYNAHQGSLSCKSQINIRVLMHYLKWFLMQSKPQRTLAQYVKMSKDVNKVNMTEAK